MYTPSTIPESISRAKDEDLTHEKLFLKASFISIDDNEDNIVFNLTSLMNKYLDTIKANYIQLIELSEEEFMKYKYNPKLLCLDTYGTTELWSSLLTINNMLSQVDFKKQKIYMFTNNILEFLDEMFILEERNINDNIQHISNITKK